MKKIDLTFGPQIRGSKLGEGKWGCKKCRRIPKREGDWQRRVPKCCLPENLFKTRDLELPIFEGSLPSCSPHSAGYTRTSVHPYFPVANQNSFRRIRPQIRVPEVQNPLCRNLSLRIWWSACLGSVSGTVWGATPGTSSRHPKPHLVDHQMLYIQSFFSTSHYTEALDNTIWEFRC